MTRIHTIRETLERTGVKTGSPKTPLQWDCVFAKIANTLDNLPMARGDTSNATCTYRLQNNHPPDFLIFNNMVMVVLRVNGKISCGEYDADVSGVSVYLMHDEFSSFRCFAEKRNLDLALGNFHYSSQFPSDALLAVISIGVCKQNYIF